MIAVRREDAEIAIAGNGAEMRTKELGAYTVAFARLDEGVDLGPALQGLPDDLCPCPHWGYMLKGRAMKMATPSSAHRRAHRRMTIRSTSPSRPSRQIRPATLIQAPPIQRSSPARNIRTTSAPTT